MSQAARSESFGPTIPLPTATPLVIEESASASMLLKSPHTFARLVAEHKVDWHTSMVLFGTALGFYMVYGIATGFFAGGNSLWQAAIKTPMILLGTVALCAPSLYVLLCMGGTQIRVRQVAALLAALACLSSLLMIGFAPVAWLFAVSTNNLQSMVALHAIVWGVGLGCGLRLVGAVVPGGYRHNKPLVAWAGIFLLVCVQTLTFFRPLLGVSVKGGFRDPDKQFFFQHLYASMTGQVPGAAPEIPEVERAPAPVAPIDGEDFVPPPPLLTPVSN